MIIEPLGERHDRSGFDCGNEELIVFLKSYAGTWSRWNIGRTFVAIQSPDEPRVIGYYTLGMAGVNALSLAEKLGVEIIPVVLLDRLAVDKAFQGRGVGEGLLIDALARAYRVSKDQIAAYAVFVEALDDCARSFYLHYGFQQLEDDPLHLFITMRTIGQLGLLPGE